MDTDAGMCAWGGDLVDSEDSLVLKPCSGLGAHVRMLPPGIAVDIDGAHVQSMTWKKETGTVMVEIVNPSQYSVHAYLQTSEIAPPAEGIFPYAVEAKAMDITLEPQQKYLLETRVIMK